jgi:plasmid stability protein
LLVVKQILLRVPDQLHRRLSARAARAHQSINATATEILDSAVDADVGDRRARLRARAAALGIFRATSAPTVSPARRRRVVASTKGAGQVLDQLLADDREHA